MSIRRLRKFKTWRRENEIGQTKSYELVKAGKIKIVKIGRASYIEEAEGERFLDSLTEQAA